MDLSWLLKIPFMRLTLVAVVAMAALQAYLYAGGGHYERIDDSVVGGLLLALAMGLINTANEHDRRAENDRRPPRGAEQDARVLGWIGLALAFVGFSLLYGEGFVPWDWPPAWWP